jgi:hypothetical protein
VRLRPGRAGVRRDGPVSAPAVAVTGLYVTLWRSRFEGFRFDFNVLLRLSGWPAVCGGARAGLRAAALRNDGHESRAAVGLFDRNLLFHPSFLHPLSFTSTQLS